ncbi:MAG: GTP 3',8-cyclase MoaA [Bacteroidetes bacterium]|nr:MAG: GTP 3',8-cyclase MoaA [Bacteroidota bacterium]
MLIDSFNRIHDYLRISLTDNCNLRCFYCMPEENYSFTPSSRLMQAAEIASLAKIFVSEGVKKIRLTGGEPLVRKDASVIIQSLANLPVRLAITTNATRLRENLEVLVAAKMSSVNISLDTLRADRFQLITRRDLFKTVYENIGLALQAGIHVKLNMVVMKGVNEDEINDFIEWTKFEPVHVRFIEFMPFSGNKWSSEKVFTWQQMMAVIGSRYTFERMKDELHDTSKRYSVPGHAGSFSVISTMSAPFCDTCNRVRLTADGKIKNCLFSKEETDLLTPFREGKDILPLIRKSIANKARQLGGQFDTDFEHLQAANIHNRTMISIGG